MSSPGSPQPQKEGSHDDGKSPPGFLSSLQSMHFPAKNNAVTASPPSHVSKRIVSNVHGKSVLAESRKSFFQRHVPGSRAASREHSRKSNSNDKSSDHINVGGGGGGGGTGNGTNSKPRVSSPRLLQSDSGNNGMNSSSHHGMKPSMRDLQPFWLKGLIVNKNRSIDSAEFWIENPIHCGYLHAYCLGDSYPVLSPCFNLSIVTISHSIDTQFLIKNNNR